MIALYLAFTLIFIHEISVSNRLRALEEQNAILSLLVEDMLNKPEDNK